MIVIEKNIFEKRIKLIQIMFCYFWPILFVKMQNKNIFLQHLCGFRPNDFTGGHQFDTDVEYRNISALLHQSQL